MSDESTTPQVASEAPTAPLTQPAEQPAAPAAAPVAAPAEKPARSSASMYVFAVAAALVLAVGLSAVSFGAGVFVGRLGGAGRGVAASGPVASGSGQPSMPDAGRGGFGGHQDYEDGEDQSGTQRGQGRMRGGFPGHPGGQNSPTLPNGQSVPAVPNAQ